MSRSAQYLQEAADWLTRLQRPEVDETDWLAFDAWLSEPGAQEAYDAIQAVDEEIFQRGSAVRGELAVPRRAVAAKRGLMIDWRWLGGLGAAAAAAAVAIVVAPWGELLPQPDTLYTTAKGENRAVQLADGSHIDLTPTRTCRSASTRTPAASPCTTARPCSTWPTTRPARS